ncbi:hypothetical protein GTQ99_22655 [Kineococcus sp. T13]|uniref:hypothetical protein n=1 Tax=Kineococcus vitellinus TaxID=2696565 RepID=UPI001413136F|nr:hypothetical protein [Kineococcus vitellinus]NAZ78187.1 hypothetical protein [Kineococcus vitellinus]
MLTWSQVEAVQVQGRWQEHSTITTRPSSGAAHAQPRTQLRARPRTLPLTGMPAQDAQRLADALQR